MTDRRNQHERFVRDAIARSLLTLPFAHLDREDPHGQIYGYYKELLKSAETGELPPQLTLSTLVGLISEDITNHEECGNYLKAEIERNWCEGLMLHFTWGQELVAP